MSSKSEHFAERIKQRMRELGLRTHDDVEDEGGPSSPTLTKILKARSDSLSTTSAKKLERALGLARGTATTSFEDDTDLVLRSERMSAEELDAEIARLEAERDKRRGHLSTPDGEVLPTPDGP